MVTDEERDYMYRAFAHEPTMRINLGIRRRLAPLVGDGRRQVELMDALLMSLPGTPVLYDGDEIGMGDNVFLGDRNGVRTPMQWSPDRNAGFSRANPQRLVLPVIIDPEYHYESLNVEAQQGNPNSLLWWMKRLIALRKRFQAFGRGSIEFLSPENAKVLAFIRRFEEETVLVVANLSRFPQCVELDLRSFKGNVPIELIGKTRFPTIGELPYLLTLGEHAFYWFSLEEPKTAAQDAREASYQPPLLEVPSGWEGPLTGGERSSLEMVLPAWLEGRRWFHGRAREISQARIQDIVPVDSLRFAMLEVEFSQGEPEQYVLPLTLQPEEKSTPAQAVIAVLRRSDGSQLQLVDALSDSAASAALLEAIRTGTRSRAAAGLLVASARPGLPAGEARLYRQEHHAASVQYGDALLLKFYRRLGEGMSPELEIGRALTERAPNAPIAPLWGAIELRPRRGEPITIATLHGWVQNQGTSWHFFREELRRYFQRALATSRELKPSPRAPRGRIHGEYHVGNVLWTGKDFIVVDFGQNPNKPLPERRRKRSGLRDIASMLRSFDLAATMALRDTATVRESERGAAEPWAKLWSTWAPAAFLAAYLEGAKGSPFLPETRAELEMLLHPHVIEKALDELEAELGRRDDWALAAVRAILEYLG